MPESEKARVARIFQVFVPLVGVTIALVSFLTTLAFRKKELTVAYLGSERVVSEFAGGIDPRVKISLEGEPISSLSKMNFVVRNSGSAAIKAEDVKEPIRLSFDAGARLLNVLVERTFPPEFTFHAFLADSKNVQCEFPLLNTGDEAHFSVYVYNSEPKIPSIKGRIVDVKQIAGLDESSRGVINPFPFVKSVGVRKTLYWTLFLINASLALLFAWVELSQWVRFVRFRLWTKEWKDRYIGLLRKEYPSTSETRLPSLIGVLSKAKLTEHSIPEPPNPAEQNWKGHLGFSFVMAALFILTALTSIFIYFSPRGY